MEQLMNAFVLALLSLTHPSQAKPPAIPVEDWPDLKITEHLVSAMPAPCRADAPGCAVVRLSEGTCDIYVALREPQKAPVRERQLKHCRGYDEPPYRLREAYARWMETKAARAHRVSDAEVVAAVE